MTSVEQLSLQNVPDADGPPLADDLFALGDDGVQPPIDAEVPGPVVHYRVEIVRLAKGIDLVRFMERTEDLIVITNPYI